MLLLPGGNLRLYGAVGAKTRGNDRKTRWHFRGGLSPRLTHGTGRGNKKLAKRGGKVRAHLGKAWRRAESLVRAGDGKGDADGKGVGARDANGDRAGDENGDGARARGEDADGNGDADGAGDVDGDSDEDGDRDGFTDTAGPGRACRAAPPRILGSPTQFPLPGLRPRLAWLPRPMAAVASASPGRANVGEQRGRQEQTAGAAGQRQALGPR